MDRRGRRHRDRRRRSDGLDLQAGRRRPGQDDHGAGELRRRRGHRPDADQRRNRHDTAERRHAGGDRRHGEFDAAADIGRSDQPRHLRQARAHRIHRAVPPGGNGNRHADVHLHAGHSTRQATYYAGSGTDTLRFSYAVSGGSSDVDADGISWQANAIALNGGTITRPDLTSTAATLEHDAAGNQPEHKVDGRIGVTLTTVVRVEPASTPELRSDTYPPGEVTRIAVTVSGGDGGGRPAARFSPASRRSQADGLRPTTRPAAPPPGWCSATRYWRRTRAPNGISIGDHRTTWDLDANDLIRTSATKVTSTSPTQPSTHRRTTR